MKQLLRKNRFLLLLFFLILFNIGLSVQLYFLKQKETSKVTEVLTFETMAKEKKFHETDENYKIAVYYPVTTYSNLNLAIEHLIEENIKNFKEEILFPNTLNQTSRLDIVYELYSTKEYLSYVFTIFQDTLGAHPISFYNTISYDIENQQLITIDDLVNQNPNFLEIVSKNVRDTLLKNKRIVNTDMLMQGTMPKSENFSTFVFTKEGYLFFFSPYQVAPYSSGKFEVLVPYEKFME